MLQCLPTSYMVSLLNYINFLFAHMYVCEQVYSVIYFIYLSIFCIQPHYGPKGLLLACFSYVFLCMSCDHVSFVTLKILPSSFRTTKMPFITFVNAYL